MSTDPALWPAHRQAAAIRAKELSSTELLDAFTARIERLNPAVNAVVTLDVERGKKAAAQADDAIARGDAVGPLHGLPVTIKDALAVEGVRSTGGAVELTDHVPDADAEVVARAVDAGAFCFGKTNLPRWSGDLQSFNEIFGTTNNPWDVSRVPGRLVGRGGDGGGAGLHRLRDRHRHRRLDPHPRRLLRHRRPQAELRPRAHGRLPRPPHRRA